MGAGSVMVMVVAAVALVAADPKCVPELTADTPDFATPTFTGFRASDFNVISFDSVVADTGDIQGRVAARNDLRFGNGFSVGDQLEVAERPPIDRAVRDSVVAGGQIVWGSGAVYPDGSGNPFPGAAEGIFAGGRIQAPEYIEARRDGAPCDDCLDEAFDSIQEYYADVSSRFAEHATNVAVRLEHGSGLFLTGLAAAKSHNTRYYVSISPADFNAASWWSASNTNVEAEFVITITGTEDITFSGGEFPGIPERVVWNIPGERTIFVQTEVVGSILAPQATVQQTGGVIKGFVVAQNVAHLLQVNKLTCGGCDCCNICEDNSFPVFSDI